MHTWNFQRTGGFDQVVLAHGADLLNLANLDPKLWAALACPTTGLELDPKTLELVDADHDGRIRLPEVVAAVQWALATFKNKDDLLRGQAELPLERIDETKPEGAKILASARSILSGLGKGSANVITVDDTADTQKILAAMRYNGDGVVPPEAAEDDATRALLADIVATVGSVVDRSGKPGVDKALAERFFQEVAAHQAWQAKAQADATLRVLGDGTEAAANAVAAVETKVDDWFTRASLATFDARAAGLLDTQEADLKALAGGTLTAASATISALPLAHVDASGALPLDQGLNPAWSGAIAALRDQALRPLLGELKALRVEQWALVQAKLAPFRAWRAAPEGSAVAKLGAERLLALQGEAPKALFAAILTKEEAMRPEAEAIALVDRTVRYHRDLATLLQNFVCFRDFYAGKRSIFQVGTLYLDERACDLVLRVDDAGKHAALASQSRALLLYCDCVRKSSGEKMTIVAAMTNGDSDNLFVGRNGVFYDRKGRDWDATITKIIDNPISVRQAFWSPYKKIAKFIEQQIEAFASSREKAVEASAQSSVAGAAETATAGAKPASQTFDVAKFAGIFAAIGLALGTLGGAVGAMLSAFASLAWWQMPLAVAGLMLLVSGPSMLLAWLKLRQRNLGPLLDANGWAVNTRALVNVRFGATLTKLATLPPGAARSVEDPYGAGHGRRNALLVVLVLLFIAYVLVRASILPGLSW